MNKSGIKEQIEAKGSYISTIVGDSMFPMLRDRKDLVLVEKPKGRLKRYDLPLYQRPSGQYVLHRVLWVHSDYYTICGDNRWQKEKVPNEWIVGVMKGFYRGEKFIPASSFLYKLYVHIWCDFYFIRGGILYLKGLPGRLKKRIARKWKKLLGKS